MNAPLPNFTAIVRATPVEGLRQLRVALLDAESMTLERIVEEAAVRRQKATPETTNWISTGAAARIADLDMSTAAKARAARGRIASWAKGKAWASHISKRKLIIGEAGFRRWLDVKRST